jgi:predicted  nucleic acid-binding Zn-ribbon protein
MQHLEKQVSETAAVVADWKNSIAKIETQFNVAGLALARAKKTREAHALKAAMNDAAAVAAIKDARAEQLAAEQTIDDLKIALPEMEAQLADAERAAASARHQLAKFAAEVLMKRRIDVAGKLDAVIADFSRLYAEYEKLGREIVNMDVMPRDMHGGISNHEGAVGARRVRASLPAFFLETLSWRHT